MTCAFTLSNTLLFLIPRQSRNTQKKKTKEVAKYPDNEAGRERREDGFGDGEAMVTLYG